MSIKRNFFYSSILIVSNYIFPLLTYPYVSRVLGVTGIGAFNFVDSIIQYFIIFSMLGISYVGVKETATTKSTQSELNESFSCLFLLNAIMTFIALVVYLIIVFSVDSLSEYKELFFIGMIKIVGNLLMVDWFYRGIEEFKYITRRTIFVKTLYVISVFVFVRNSDDCRIYLLLSCLMVAVNGVFNVLYLKKFVSFQTKNLNLKKYLKSNIIMGLYLILTSMYSTFNITYLGMVNSVTEVGYYSTSIKILFLLLAFYSAFTGVMLPRMSVCIKSGDKQGFSVMLNKSVNILIAISIPIIIFSVLQSQDIVVLLAGTGFQGAVIPFMIIMPLVFLIGYDQILVVQVLLPSGYEKKIFYNSFVVACVGISLNVLFVGRYGAIASAVILLICEIVVFILSQRIITKIYDYSLPIKAIFKNVIAYLPVVVIILLFNSVTPIPNFMRIILCVVVFLSYTIAIQLLYLKNDDILNILYKMKDRVRYGSI